MTGLALSVGTRSTSRPRVRRRVLLFAATGLGTLFVLLTVSLTTGEMSIPAGTALRALVGLGDPGDVLVVQEFRAPRTMAAIVAGAGLGAAGCVLQRLFRNPLASPDVMGVTGGASLGAVALIAAGASQSLIPVGALGGGLLAALLLGVFAWRSGLAVTRLVLTGLAVQAGTRRRGEPHDRALPRRTRRVGPPVDDRLGVRAHLDGGVGRGRRHGRSRSPSPSSCTGGWPCSTSGTTRRARSASTRPAARLQLLVVAVVLASLAAALAGPVTFVALAVPHIVRFVTGPPTAVSLALAGLTGAVLLLASDLVVQHLLPVEGLPVGAVTATLGAPWLLVLMFRQSSPVRRSQA